mmetsp:Transcript_30781/g.39728  ORF Transcript_30781/g.39728 Transcript_30781/m.39728 type:complete len:112 (+) Transcript_30781:109-444(+)
MSPEQLTATVIALSLSLSIVCYHGSNMNFGRILTKWNQNTVKRGRSVKKVGLSRAASLKVWWITIHCCVVKQEIVCDRNFLKEKFNKCVKNSTASKHKSHKANLYFEMFNE